METNNYLRLTFPQMSIYEEEKFIGGAVSNICGSLLLDKKYSEAEITFAINKIFEINPALRLKIVNNEGGVWQTVANHTQNMYKISSFSSEDELNDFCLSLVKEPISLEGELCFVYPFVLNDKSGFIIKMHHIVGDAFSAVILSNQLISLLNGENVEAGSYVDFIKDDENYSVSKKYNKDKEYYLRKYKEINDFVTFGSEGHNCYKSNRIVKTLSEDLTDKILKYSENNETTPTEVLITAFSLIFSRLCNNTEQFFLGLAVINRVDESALKTAGMFVNASALFCEVDYRKSFLDNLKVMQSNIFDLYRHSRFNCNSALKAIRKENSDIKSLYDVLISFQNGKTDNIVKTKWYNNGLQAEALQIHIDDRENSGKFNLNFDYREDRLSAFQVNNLISCFEKVLNDCLVLDSVLVDEISLDYKSRLSAISGEAKEYPINESIYSLFEKTALQNRNNICIQGEGTELTFGELLNKACSLDKKIQTITKGEKQVIGIIADRSEEMYLSIYSIIRGGNAYMPISPDYPKDRVLYMLQNSEAKIVLAQGKYLSVELPDGITLINVTDFKDKAKIERDFPSKALCTDTAYVLYTSGSTGRPKGVKISNRSVINRVLWMEKEYPLGDNGVILQKTPYTFDVSVWEMFWWGIIGKKLVYMNANEHFLPRKILDYCNEYKVTHLHFVPSVFEKLVSFLENNRDKIELLHSVKHIFLSGEAMPKILAQRFYSICPDLNICLNNLYGPTECTVDVTYYNIVDVDISEIPIGKPVDNTDIYITDGRLSLLPVGFIGEICVGGIQVAQGYINNPDLTREKFSKNPYGEGNLYKTGDLGYVNENGEVIFCGRADGQIKLNGQRIELKEIESVATDVDGIDEAVAVIQKNENGASLVLYYTGKFISNDKIVNSLSEKLPNYMIPKAIMHIKEMPLNLNGKLDRKRLPAVAFAEKTKPFVEPETQTDKIICREIKNVLNLNKEVSLNDSFISLGGDSLKAIELLSRLEAFDIEINISDIFENKSVGEYTVNRVGQKENNIPKIINESVASEEQKKVYIHQQLHPSLPLYNIPLIFERENIDAEKLENAVNKVIKRHSSLRTHFEIKDDKILQIIDDKCICKVQTIDSIEGFIRPFNLNKSPLMRVGLCDNKLIFDFSHSIFDGHSISLFFRELDIFYNQKEIDTVPRQYCEYKKSLDNVRRHKYKANFIFENEANKNDLSGKLFAEKTDDELFDNVLLKCKKLGITPFVFFMSAYALLISKISAKIDISIGVALDTRSSEFSNSIGMFVNSVPYKFEINSEMTVKSFFALVGKMRNDANEQKYSYNENAEFDCMFSYQGDNMQNISFLGEKISFQLPDYNTAKYPLTLFVTKSGEDNILMAEYRTAIFTDEQIKNIITEYKKLICSLLDESKKISEVFEFIDKGIYFENRSNNKIIGNIEHIEPQTQLEKYVCKRFAELSGKTDIGMNDNFSELGGTSLDIITLLSDEKFKNVEPSLFLKNPTPRGLIDAISGVTERFEMIKLLGKGENVNKTIVLFPYAGGNELCFSALCEKLKNDNVQIYFAPFVHSYSDCEKISREIMTAGDKTQIVFYAHCVGGSVALKTAEYLEKIGQKIKHIYLGGNIPKVNAPKKNIWNYVPEFIIEFVLKKAGSEIGKLEKSEKTEILKRFKSDTSFSVKYFSENHGKLNTPITCIYSKDDLFTENYAELNKSFKRFTTGEITGLEIGGNDHYFQNSQAGKIADIIINKCE